jgi:hypothetical protein
VTFGPTRQNRFVHYEAFDFTTEEDVLIGKRDTFPQAVEMAFRYIATHPGALTVSVHQALDSGKGPGLLWRFNPDDPGHQERVAAARRAIEAGEPENLRHGLP